MRSRWSDSEAAAFVERYGRECGQDLALRTYTSRLLGAEPSLVLHGGGNTSVKTSRVDPFGRPARAIFVKASGRDLADIEPDGHSALDLPALESLRALDELPDGTMIDLLRTRLLSARSATPSIETLVHAFLPGKFIDHTHADAVLALGHADGGEEALAEALGGEVVVLPYVAPGFRLARAADDAMRAHPGARGMVWMHHGLVTWGSTARESYESMLELVTKAEQAIEKRVKDASRAGSAGGDGLAAPGRRGPSRRGSGPDSAAPGPDSLGPGPDSPAPGPDSAAPGPDWTRPGRTSIDFSPTPLETARARLARLAPVLRGCLAEPSGDPDHPYRRMVLAPLVDREILDFLERPRGKDLALTPPLTTDHLIRTKALPAWIDAPDYGNEARLRDQIAGAICDFAAAYTAYLSRHARRMPQGVTALDPFPRVVLLPGAGAVGAGEDADAARIARDIAAHTLRVKAQVAAMGRDYVGLSEAQLFDMEYRPMQHDKLVPEGAGPLRGVVALVTGAAGAIGSGICRELLANGALVAATDLPGPRLDSLVEGLGGSFAGRCLPVALDVTDRDSVARGFERAAYEWGGIDLLVVNAGAAMASPLASLDVEDFRRLERVNVEGTLLPLAEGARHFERQGTGGDIVFVSTKNVFSPGAGFGAYSATKAAAHQLARIASLELAPLDVRVNMVAPDAVFSDGNRRSGLWAEIGSERMRSRGLDAAGLEDYYRDRNLLKARITARHVGRAVVFFATRQIPVTGVTLPVDGGLPDATPR